VTADIESNQCAASQIHEMTAGVFHQMLDLPVQLRDSGEDTAESTSTVTSCVQITGDWVGAVALRCPRDFAFRVTSILFQEEATALKDDDVYDAMGEMGNVLAGNFKAALPGSSMLALPSVTAGTNYSIDLRGCGLMTEVALVCDGFPFTLTVLKKDF
jgi:chemotaxis protein CheX